MLVHVDLSHRLLALAMFEKTLTALIKGLRSHRGKDEAKYIAAMMDDIRGEIKSADMDIKAEAVLKLAYLHMLGYRLSSASFHILETMASSNYRFKFIGYLAASLCFSEDTEVLILATNLIKKDLHSAQPLDVQAALHGLSHIMTQELAQHLSDDIILMLSHTRAPVRKRAVLVLHAVILRCPEVLDRTYERLRDLLCDENLGVVTATVNVICELARRNPAPFVPLSPQLFEILTMSNNNWLLIKVIKLFGALSPVEPRLVRKLYKPIMSIMSTTPAMSLLYECIHTVIIGGMLERGDSDELARRCVENLGVFLQNDDQNLRYISILALDKLAPSHPHLVAQHQNVILKSIQHPDMTIRVRALELVARLATDPMSLRPIVDYLMLYLGSADETLAAPSAAQTLQRTLDADQAQVLETSWTSDLSGSKCTEFRTQVAECILDLGGANHFSRIRDLSWYMHTLIRLAHLVNDSVIPRVVDQLMEFVFYHSEIQAEASSVLFPMLLDPHMYDAENPMSEVLRACATICSEYVEQVDSIPRFIEALLQDAILSLSPPIISVCIQSAMKMFAYWAAQLSDTWSQGTKLQLLAITETMQSQLTKLASNEDAEVFERCKEGLQLFELLQNGLNVPSDAQPKEETCEEQASSSETSAPRALFLLLPLFYARSELVASPEPLPASLDLQAWIAPESSWTLLLNAVEPAPKPPKRTKPPRHTVMLEEKVPSGASPLEPTSSQRRPQADPDNPFYLKPRSKKSSKKKADSRPVPPPQLNQDEEDLRDIPIVKLNLSDFASQQHRSDDTLAPISSIQPKVVSHKKSARRK